MAPTSRTQVSDRYLHVSYVGLMPMWLNAICVKTNNIRWQYPNRCTAIWPRVGPGAYMAPISRTQVSDRYLHVSYVCTSRSTTVVLI